MKILISAAEASSDLHGAELLKAIRSRVGERDSLQAFGMGGPKLQAEGLRAVVDARDFLSMGFIEILSRLPRVFRALRTLESEAAAQKPDVAIFIDYPDFHFRLAKRLHRLGVPLVYFIPPKVWAWRQGRVEFLRRYFKRVLCILPFEVDFYRSHQMPVSYVGNPLLDELPLSMSRDEARAKLGLSRDQVTLALLAGSRPAEINHHLELVLAASEQVRDALVSRGRLTQEQRLEILLPFPMTAPVERLEARIRELFSPDRFAKLSYRVLKGDSALALKAADAALVKSGTSTLEAGLLGCPHVVFYKPNFITSWIFFNLIRYSGPVGLVNLCAEPNPPTRRIAREILASEVTSKALADEAIRLLEDSAYRSQMLQDFSDLLARMQKGVASGLGPSAAAAEEILNLCGRS